MNERLFLGSRFQWRVSDKRSGQEIELMQKPGSPKDKSSPVVLCQFGLDQIIEASESLADIAALWPWHGPPS
jgi:hypothetical protein